MTLLTAIVAALTAAAIAQTDATPHEARLLMRIAELEGQWRPEVVDCRVRGDRGRAHGLWQIHPRTAEEARDACTLLGGARLALERVRESLRACGDLSAYCSGRCGVGMAEARARWVE